MTQHMIYVWSGYFFFSSRRRHTRWTGDWSSDVCSSDLDRQFLAGRPLLLAPPEHAPESGQQFVDAKRLGNVIVRSEDHTSELQSPVHLVCRLLLEKKKTKNKRLVWSSNHSMYIIHELSY